MTRTMKINSEKLIDFYKKLEFLSFELEYHLRDLIRDTIEIAKEFFKEDIPQGEKKASIEERNSAAAEMLQWSFEILLLDIKHILSLGYECGLTYPDASETLGLIQLIYDRGVYVSNRINHSPAGEYSKYRIRILSEYFSFIDEQKLHLRLAELASRIKVYCDLENPAIEKTLETQRDEIDELLDKDVCQAIVKFLGTQKKTRAQMTHTEEFGYCEGGHIGETLYRMENLGVLLHDRPYYQVNPAFYKKLGICPDKDGQ